MHYLYILFSYSSKRYYVGSSSNPEGRLLAHNHPSNKGWPKRYRPWKLVFKKAYESRIEAQRSEKKIKSFKSSDMLRRIINQQWSLGSYPDLKSGHRFESCPRYTFKCKVQGAKCKKFALCTFCFTFFTLHIRLRSSHCWDQNLERLEIIDRVRFGNG